MFQLKERPSLADELYEAIENRKFYEKREKELKDHYKLIMEHNNVSICEIGSVVLILTNRETTTIDRDLLAEVLGVTEAKKLEKTTQYKVLEVKKVA